MFDKLRNLNYNKYFEDKRKKRSEEDKVEKALLKFLKTELDLENQKIKVLKKYYQIKKKEKKNKYFFFSFFLSFLKNNLIKYVRCLKRWYIFVKEYKITISSKDFLFINLNKYHYFSIFYLFETNLFTKLSIIDFCNVLDITIPHYCYHPDLSISGNCRMCLIELDTSIKPIASCAINVIPNIEINTSSNLVKKLQHNVLEFLLLNHPLDCPVCDQGGECDLQDISYTYGNIRGRFIHTNDLKRAISDTNCNSFIKFVLTRCIHCTRCVRFLMEWAGNFELGLLGRGKLTEIGLYLDKNLLNSELGSNIIELCPVGALTSKIYSFRYRSWENLDYESYDFNDSNCLSLKIYFKHNLISRVLPSFDYELNNIFLTEKARYSFDTFLLQRFEFPLMKKYVNTYLNIRNIYKNFFLPISWKYLKKVFIYTYITKRLKSFCNINLKIILGDITDLNLINYFKFVLSRNGNNFFFSNSDNNIFNLFKYDNVEFDFRQNYLLNMQNLNKFKFCFLLSVNLRVENAIMNAKLRQEFLWNQLIIYSFLTNSSSLTYSYKFINNNTLDFIKILEGRHWLNLILKKFDNYSKLFLIGSDFFNKLPNLNKNYLKMFLNNFYLNFSYMAVYKNVSKINFLDQGYFFGKFSYIFNENFNLKRYFNFYLYFGSNLKLLTNWTNKKQKINQYNISQNPFFFETENKIDLHLPTLTLYESKKKSYINCLGLVRKILFLENFTFSKFKLMNDFEVIFIIFSILPTFLITYSQNKLSNFFFNLLNKQLNNSYLKLFINNFLINTINLEKIKLSFKNVLFCSSEKNMYKINLINFLSKNLTTLSNSYFKNFTNFKFS